MRANFARGQVVRRLAALLLLAFVATACATPNATRYRTQREDLQRSGGTFRPADAGEQLFEGATELDRRELVRQVLERNPNIRAARHAWQAALALYPQVIALEDPMLGAGVAPLSIGSKRVDDAPSFDLSQKLPFPGKLRLRGEAALGEAEAASHDYEAVRLRLATMASLVFDDYAQAARSLEINAEHIVLLEELKEVATLRYEVGEASQQDPLQAEVELAHGLHRKIAFGTAQRIAAGQLNALLHRPASATLPPAPIRSGTPAAASEAADQLVAEALEDRPEVAAAGARITAEEARVALAWREYFPDITLVGAYDGRMQARDLEPFVGVQLSVPLQLDRRKAAVEEAEARLEVARNQRLAIVDEVRFGVQSSLERLTEAGYLVHLFRDRLLPVAGDQIAAARAGFETGRNSFPALIDAERNLRTVELGYEEALADVSRRRADLDWALGRIPGLSW